MDVGVNQAGEQSAVAQIDHSGARWMRYRGAGFRDAVSPDEKHAWRDHAARRNIEQAGGYAKATGISFNRFQRPPSVPRLPCWT
jgi:hypothetical protein